MLRITYTGGDAPQRFLFDPDEVDVEEAERIEQALGSNWDSLLMSLMSPSARLRRVLLWHLLRQANPDYPLRFEETPKFKMGQLTIELGTREIDHLVNEFASNDTWTDARKAQAIEALLAERPAAALAESGLEVDEVTVDPKDTEPPAPVVESGYPVREGAPDQPFPADCVQPVTATWPNSPTT